MTKTFVHPEKPGQYFKDGKFYIFSKRSIHVMRSWPQPQSWIKSSQKGWRPERKLADKFFCRLTLVDRDKPPAGPPAPVPLPAIPEDSAVAKVLEAFGGTAETEARNATEKQNKATYAEWRSERDFYDFIGQIPENIRRIVHTYRERRWHMLNLLARCPGADELHHSNPALCYMLASNWIYHKPAVQQPMRAARSLIRRPQRKILEWLGFPGNEAARRILAKIRPEALSGNALLYLRTALADPTVCKLLGHLPAINSGVLFLVSADNTRACITPNLLAEVAADPEQAHDNTTYRTLCDIHNMVGMTGDNACPQRFASTQRLTKVHDRLTERLNKMFDNGADILYDLRGVPQTLPAPPSPVRRRLRPSRRYGAYSKRARTCTTASDPMPVWLPTGACTSTASPRPCGQRRRSV